MGLLSALGSVAGTVFGGPLGGSIGGALGGALEGGASAAGGNQRSLAAQQAAQQAARAAQFRPVGITNTFGTSNFGYDSAGNLTSAGYTMSPQLQSYQNALMSNQGQNLQDISNIQNMGRAYMAQSPQQAAENWMAGQQALLQPARQQAQANLNNQLFTQGTGGLSVAQAGGGMANPQQQAVANAQALQDLQLAAQAQQAGQQQYTFGQGLLSSAYQPYTAGLTAMGATESLGQSPMDISTALGSKSATAGSNAGRYMASTAYAYSPSGTRLTQLGNASAGIFGQNANPSLNPLTGNAYGWTTGLDVIPQSTFSGGGSSLMDPELAALIGL